MEKNCKEVLDKIKEVRTSKSSRLNLYRKQLIQIPEEVWSLSHLTYLNLGDNILVELPDEIENLTNLIHLYLDCNQLKTLPKAIGKLSIRSDICVTFSEKHF